MRNDLDLYERHAEGWWDPRAPAFRSLRAVKQHHLAQLRDHLGPALAGARVADLGCGGGLLSIPLAEAGAHVFGVDLSAGSLDAAAREAAARGVVFHGRTADLRDTGLETGAFDLVLLSDVVEHLRPFEPALAEAARLTRPHGMVYVNTLNRTRRATWLAVHLAEGVGLVPKGTHDPRWFVTPDELRDAAHAHGLHLTGLRGERVALWQTLRRRAIHVGPGRSTAVGYSAFFVRRPVT